MLQWPKLNVKIWLVRLLNTFLPYQPNNRDFRLVQCLGECKPQNYNRQGCLLCVCSCSMISSESPKSSSDKHLVIPLELCWLPPLSSWLWILLLRPDTVLHVSRSSLLTVWLWGRALPHVAPEIGSHTFCVLKIEERDFGPVNLDLNSISITLAVWL